MTVFDQHDEQIPEIDPEGPLDLTGDAEVDGWRGVAAEDVDEVGGGLAGLLRSRSRALLGSLLQPHRAALGISGVLIAVHIGARLAGPWLIMRGIDDGIPPLLDGGSGELRPLLTTVILFFAITILGTVCFNAFLLITGRVGQEIVLDIRRRLFRSLSVAEHGFPRAIHQREA